MYQAQEAEVVGAFRPHMEGGGTCFVALTSRTVPDGICHSLGRVPILEVDLLGGLLGQRSHALSDLAAGIVRTCCFGVGLKQQPAHLPGEIQLGNIYRGTR